MEIPKNIPPIQQTPDTQKPDKAEVKGPAARPAKGDQVALSPKAQELQRAHAAVSAMGDVDHEKVAAIKDKIQAGTYEFDADKIAAKMLEESF